MFRSEKVDTTPKVLPSENSFKTPIDNYDAQEFNLNDAGWVRNDISQRIQRKIRR